MINVNALKTFVPMLSPAQKEEIVVYLINSMSQTEKENIRRHLPEKVK